MRTRPNLNQRRRRLDEEVVRAIQDLLDYLALDEVKDFAESPGDRRRGHILHPIAKIEEWLSGEPTTPDDLVEDRRRSIPDYRPEPARGCCGDCDRGEELDRVDRRTHIAGQALAAIIQSLACGEIWINPEAPEQAADVAIGFADALTARLAAGDTP